MENKIQTPCRKIYEKYVNCLRKKDTCIVQDKLYNICLRTVKYGSVI